MSTVSRCAQIPDVLIVNKTADWEPPTFERFVGDLSHPDDLGSDEIEGALYRRGAEVLVLSVAEGNLVVQASPLVVSVRVPATALADLRPEEHVLFLRRVSGGEISPWLQAVVMVRVV